jgi:predicted O-methyltransferase YrrM
MKTLDYIKKKYQLRYKVPMPIELPITRTTGLTKLFKELGFKTGAEIGVSNGFYSKWLLSSIRGLKLYCIDPYEVYDDLIETHALFTQDMENQAYENAKKRLARWNPEIIRKRSMDAVKDFKDNSLDFVFIDGNHTFQYCMNDVAEWEKKVRPGGIIAVHDFWNSVDRKKLYVELMEKRDRIKLCQVKDVAFAWTKTNFITPWFITQEYCSSWFYVKS